MKHFNIRSILLSGCIIMTSLFSLHAMIKKPAKWQVAGQPTTSSVQQVQGPLQAPTPQAASTSQPQVVAVTPIAPVIPATESTNIPTPPPLPNFGAITATQQVSLPAAASSPAPSSSIPMPPPLPNFGQGAPQVSRSAPQASTPSGVPVPPPLPPVTSSSTPVQQVLPSTQQAQQNSGARPFTAQDLQGVVLRRPTPTVSNVSPEQAHLQAIRQGVQLRPVQQPTTTQAASQSQPSLRNRISNALSSFAQALAHKFKSIREGNDEDTNASDFSDSDTE